MVPTFLILAWFVLPLLVWGVMLCVPWRVHLVVVVVICLASMVVGTVILANYVWALDAYLLAEVEKYEPGTPEARRASEEWASDTGRSFLLLLSPVLTAILYGVQFPVLFGLQWLVRHMLPARSVPRYTEPSREATERRIDDGNPYQSPTVVESDKGGPHQ